MQEQCRDDRRDRDAEDRAGDAGDLEADEHGAEDDDRVDADGVAMIRGWSEFMTRSQPIATTIDGRRGALGLESDRHEHRRHPGDERAEERDRHQQARARGRDRDEVEPEHGALDEHDSAEDEPMTPGRG